LTQASRPSKDPNRAPGRRGRALLAAVRQRNVFLDATAHDMKNQLAVIRIGSQLLERQLRVAGANEPATLLDAVAAIQGSTRKLQRLVDEFLDLSRLQSGEPVEFNLQLTDLVAIARACMHEYAEAADHKLRLSTAAATVMGQWDADRLERVIDNLLSNAVKYSAPASPICITITAGQQGGDNVAVLAVQDQGVGVPVADLPKIFTPFYRGSNVTRTTAGTGIGLYGARATIEQMGGTLQLESTVGVGTTATIRLPVGSVPIPRPNAQRAATTPQLPHHQSHPAEE
jgi:signal transduction histidine kinase